MHYLDNLLFQESLSDVFKGMPFLKSTFWNGITGYIILEKMH